MYWRQIAQWLGFKPHDHILADDSLPEYERRMKHAELVAKDKANLRENKQKSLGASYRPLSFSSRLYLRYHFACQTLRKSLPGRISLQIAARFWLFRLWLSKQIQYRRYVSPTGSRRLSLVWVFLLGMGVGEWKSYFELWPGQITYGQAMMNHHRYHWITSYVIEDTYYRHKPEIYKKDNLAQAIDRLIADGLEMRELDSLNWLTLGSLCAAQGETEFAYMSMQMAHYKNHTTIGGNSLQPVETQDAMKMFGK